MFNNLNQEINLVAFLPEGLEEAGAIELKSLGAYSLKSFKCTLTCKADLACFYRLNLQARLPFRFLREISQFLCKGKESLYCEIQNACAWHEWLDPSKSFRVNVSGVNNQLRHSHFTALQVKNAIVDLQREIWGKRSSISIDSPDVCIHLHLHGPHATLSLDSSATSLHKRGYRSAMGLAPLKENIAAGLLKLSKWNDSINLVDPLCGSATFLLEAANIARGIAPGLNKRFLFKSWPDFDIEIWKSEKSSANSLFSPNKKLPKLIGCEEDNHIANDAISNITNAGFLKEIDIRKGHFRDFEFPKSPGLIVCNPPYGKRIGNEKQLESLYIELGHFFKKKASGWDLWLLSGNPRLTNFLGMKCTRRFPISNGGIDCRWLHYEIY
ncbi:MULTISPECIES: THUMP domain-containing class I SAM-dependent RNA methyltransferase [Prochlorococcus]|uniref:Predicted N6-adenine-specific DNA methylase n=1 Tax=Prochlorococcus marinus (strain SARG / CCMP1375 / SS120) TaxID=167539 RepID=Q7VEE8_PROMA|nr:MULTISPECIES: class I SAM-dependent RNA methyltransferase [Prochlorococcus]AAP99111.1 Predicted N6-adenine-specific DNA methylase [Prochlorococcus marinus subsp. marinus str. CCMP1375]KGG11629.1 putative RNA methylase family UPF0020 [Prochlorococcus marinus str. LG]KGG22363.1 putative RNA methylase family UPF0020 [Prochlorococcus marinus str. SS2]KGG22699.1 putative RNA methylase family UPF0020 [Prochlorococcus marinus str. SS35]KGG32880.1 putative RNA methylase family UPF0020 [Prochlorococ